MPGFPEIDYNETMASQALFFACGFGTLGLILVLVGVLSFWNSLASSRWPTATGEIIESSVNCWGDGDVPAARHQAKIVYRYTVRGQEYEGGRISFREPENPVKSRPEHPDELVSRYPVRKNVTVFYDPRDPSFAVLEPGAGAAAYAPVVMGGLFFVIGLVGFMVAFI